jgi:putative redox protein
MEKGYLEINLRTVNDKVRFMANSRSNPEVAIDYHPPIGNDEGYTSLELLMISFSSCISTALLTLLRAGMHRKINSLDVNARGIERTEHPKCLSNIHLDMTFVSPDAEDLDIKKAIALAEEKFCPVWAMIKGNVEVSVSFTINRE